MPSEHETRGQSRETCEIASGIVERIGRPKSTGFTPAWAPLLLSMFQTQAASATQNEEANMHIPLS